MTDQPKPEQEAKPKQKQEEKQETKPEQKQEAKPEQKKDAKTVQKQKQGEKSNYYFKIIPKEEFPKFMERLKTALAKTENKKGEKKSIDFEIRGTKEDLNGLSLEIFSFDKTKCADFMDVEQEHIKSALYCASLTVNVKTEEDAAKLNMASLMFKPMFESIPFLKGKFELFFRNKGTRCSFDVVAKEGKLVKSLIDLGIDPSEYHKFNFSLKSGIDLGELFDPNADQTKNFAKICAVIFSIKSETDNVRYLSGALAEALKDVKLNDEEIQKKFNKCVGYLNFINSFITAKLRLEYDPNVLAGEGAKEAEKISGGAENLKYQIKGAQDAVMGMSQGMIAPMINSLQMTDTVKGMDLDTISISLGVPTYKHGYAISLKIPGISKVLGGILDAAQQTGQSQQGQSKQKEQAKPEQSQPEQPKPEQSQPEQPKPEQPQPEQPKPEN
jgi:hypothetical protein